MLQPITLLIVDDHELVRRGVRTFLAKHPDIVVLAEAASGEEALALAAELAPDVALVDLVLPGMGGVEVTRHIKQLPAIRAGALSYLLKDVSTMELSSAVRKAAHGEAVLHPHVAARLVHELRGTSPARDAATPLLSEREQEVLRLVADGCSNAAIAEQLVISEYTVKNHVSNILGKLHLADRTQAAVYAWRTGLMKP